MSSPAYRAANREKIRTRERLYRAAHRERINRQARARHAANPARARSYGHVPIERKREQSNARARAYRARLRRPSEDFTKKLGKLLNLSIHGATEHERRLARQKYNQLKERRSVA